MLKRRMRDAVRSPTESSATKFGLAFAQYRRHIGSIIVGFRSRADAWLRRTPPGRLMLTALIGLAKFIRAAFVETGGVSVNALRRHGSGRPKTGNTDGKRRCGVPGILA